MRGPYHEHLLRLLLLKYAEGAFTQESLARALGQDQKTSGNYLRGKGGALDLDEADAALRHACNTTLKAFIADPARTISMPSRRPSGPLPDLLRVIDDLRENNEAIRTLLGAARGVRSAVRAQRGGNQSARQRAAGQARAIRKTGGTR